MTIQYGILFQLQVLHDFYNGTVDSSVIIEASGQTKQIMRNLRMLYKRNRGNLDLGIEVTKTENNAFQSDCLQEPLELWFTLRMTDNHWPNYTDVLPGFRKGYFFSNRKSNEVNNAISLHNSERVSDEDQLEIIGNAFVEVSGGSEVTLIRKGLLDEDLSGVIQTIQDRKGIMTNQLEEGLYELAEGEKVRSFIHLKSTTDVRGAIQILIDPVNSDFAKVVNEDWTLASPTFQIHFANKRSIWCYLISQKPLAHLEGLEITNGSETSLFEAPKETMAPDGGRRLMFASKEPLAITQKPTQFLQLKKNMNIENRSEGVVIDRLPVPNKENLYRVGEDGTILTDLFINL